MAKSKKSSRWLTLLICLFVLGWIATKMTKEPAPVPETKKATAAKPRSNKAPLIGEVKKDLGVQSFGFGSHNQAKELQALIKANPNKAEYQIFYTTDVDLVMLGCDFNKDILWRAHKKNDGSGTKEVWKGYVSARLKNGAKGGSLNDTPAGKLFGTYESF